MKILPIKKINERSNSQKILLTLTLFHKLKFNHTLYNSFQSDVLYSTIIRFSKVNNNFLVGAVWIS